MKALVCHAFGPWDGLRLEETDAPGPLAADEVRIAAEYSSVSFATGLMVEGKYQRRPPLPFVPGTECIGIVTEVGPAVTRVKPGQRVAATLDWGGHAQQVAQVLNSHDQHCGHAVGSVDEREAFLFAQLDRFDARRL